MKKLTSWRRRKVARRGFSGAIFQVTNTTASTAKLFVVSSTLVTGLCSNSAYARHVNHGLFVVSDDHSNSAYAQALCECDKAAAECFAASRNTYSRNLYNIDTDKYCM